MSQMGSVNPLTNAIPVNTEVAGHPTVCRLGTGEIIPLPLYFQVLGQQRRPEFSHQNFGQPEKISFFGRGQPFPRPKTTSTTPSHFDEQVASPIRKKKEQIGLEPVPPKIAGVKVKA